jgi:hypothetical protein
MSARSKANLTMIVCIALPLLLFILIAWIAAGRNQIPPATTETGDLKHKIDVLISHVNFINGWSLGVMGALSALGIKLMDMGRWDARVRTIIFLGFGLLAASLYAGHESRLAILNAYLGAGFADFKSAFITTMTWLQILGLIGGCLTFPSVLALQTFQPPPESGEAESP